MYTTTLSKYSNYYLHKLQDCYSSRKVRMLNGQYYLWKRLKWPLQWLCWPDLIKTVENLGKDKPMNDSEKQKAFKYREILKVPLEWQEEKLATISSLPLRSVPLGSGGGIRPSLTFSCSSFCASLLVCRRSFFCSFLVRYTPRVTGVSLSTVRQRNECAKAISILQGYKWISITLKRTSQKHRWT